jgi:hypothetical protein
MRRMGGVSSANVLRNKNLYGIDRKGERSLTSDNKNTITIKSWARNTGERLRRRRRCKCVRTFIAKFTPLEGVYGHLEPLFKVKDITVCRCIVYRVE